MGAVLLLAIVFVPMLVEAGRAARNERALRARGGIEPAGDPYGVMQLAYPAAFVAMIGERALRGPAPQAVVATGAVLFVLAKAIKWWAIVTLGPRWTFRVIVVPRAPLVSGGPYRWLRHPNYVGVVGELVSVALMAGAAVAGPVSIVCFGLILRRRIAVEERALGAILAAGSDPARATTARGPSNAQ